MSDGANGPDSGQITATDANAGANNGSNGSGVDWAADLSEDNRALVENKQWGSDTKINTILDSYRSLETHVGKAILPPGEEATDEDLQTFYRKIGAPENAEGYKFQMDTSALPEGFNYDDQSVNSFREAAHSAGIRPEQAQKLHDWYLSQTVPVFKQAQEQASEAQAEIERLEGEAHTNLVNEWGQPDSATFKGKLDLALRAMSELGIEEDLKSAGVLSADGGVKNANIVKALQRVGSEMFSEGGGGDIVNSATGENPFDNDGNLTRRSELIRLAKQDPSKVGAVQNLIRMAGKEPSFYGL